jgi:hypothetical protein
MTTPQSTGPWPYGYCPTCGARGARRERCPNGNDHCENGHAYPSRDALTSPPMPFDARVGVAVDLLAALGYTVVPPPRDMTDPSI